MIQQIFSNYLYSLITPPNKEEILLSKDIGVEEVDVDKAQWIQNCQVKVEHINPADISSLLTPSIQIFYNQLELKSRLEIELTLAWKNTYTKGSYQEIHDHLHTDENADISGCIFLEDFHPDASHFFLYNRHCSEISPSWGKIMEEMELPFKSHVIIPKAGDIIFFPSYMLHGVTPHRMEEPRTTIAFNLRFI